MIYSVYAIQRGYPLGEASLVGAHIRATQRMLEQGYGDYEPLDLQAISGLSDMITSFEFVDNVVLRCWRNECWRPDGDARHISPATVRDLLRRYALSTTMSEVRSGEDAQRADILITRHWIRGVLWNLGFKHGFVSESSNDVEFRPEYAISVASDAIEACKSFSLSVLQVHGIGLVSTLHCDASHLLYWNNDAQFLSGREAVRYYNRRH